MIFGYPLEATAENWFHECLFQMLQTIHHNLQAGEVIPDWPDIIPEPYRERLRNRPGLKDRLSDYRVVAETLKPDELILVCNTLIGQNEIERLLSAACNCATVNNLPIVIQEPIKNLFDFGFKLLTDLGIRDRQYRKIYNSLPSHVCPFCGCEYFDAPGGPREDLDHYLVKNEYPFAAVNLLNLAPMGSKCNERYKLAQNILYKGDGTRRKSFFPYNHRGVQISLDRSEPFAGEYGLFPLPLWQIDCVPDSEEATTWDSIFHIQERYKRDILNPEFISWLREFSSWCKSTNLRPNTGQDIIDALKRYSNHLDEIGIRDRAFIKAAVFRMLLRHYEQGNERLITLINGVVIGGMV